jgi:hypothetical protein
MINPSVTADMTKRNWIYGALLIFVTLGSVVDVVVFTQGTPSALTWNNVVQVFGIVVIVYWWEAADASALGRRQSSAARLLTILLPMVGHAIYLYQGRHWKRATALFLLYWGGVLIVYMAAVLVSTIILDIFDPIYLET